VNEQGSRQRNHEDGVSAASHPDVHCSIFCKNDAETRTTWLVWSAEITSSATPAAQVRSYKQSSEAGGKASKTLLKG